jgi:Glyoxalase-like domain
MRRTLRAVVLRLRQAVLAARDLEPVVAELREALGLGEPFQDPGVGTFGLHNAVMALGDTFIEVVSPVRADTAAGRHLDRRGGDGGYMVMFELDDVAGARRRAAEAGIREIWAVELEDIVDVHLHPRDVGGAILAVDQAIPAGSWRWAGPGWEGAIPEHSPGGIRGATIEAADPQAMCARWSDVLGVAPADRGTALPLDGGGSVRFVPAGERGEGLAGVDVEVAGGTPGEVEIAGVRFARQLVNSAA